PTFSQASPPDSTSGFSRSAGTSDQSNPVPAPPYSSTQASASHPQASEVGRFLAVELQRVWPHPVEHLPDFLGGGIDEQRDRGQEGWRCTAQFARPLDRKKARARRIED